MRIGVDARELAGRPTGVGRYLSRLIELWSHDPAAQAHEFVLYAPSPLDLTIDRRHFRTRVVPGSPGTWWEQTSLPTAADADLLDVFFAPAYTAPIRLRAPLVVTIHDVSFVAHPEWFRMREGLRRRWLTRLSAKRARAIITGSEFSRREILEYLNVPTERVTVIYYGVDSHWAGERHAPRVLFVGSVFNRRHVPDLIRACERLAQRFAGVTLDIVGDNRTFPRQDLAEIIRQEEASDIVRWHSYVSDGRLQELYAEARAFAFLSEYEGFGLTPLEAIASAIPAVLIDTPVARETCGEAALYVRSADVRRVADALEQVLFHEATRARLLDAAPAVIARYDWERTAKSTLAVLEKAGS